MVDLNDIALFVRVVRAGSFAEASRHIGMPANTVSRRIQQLEKQLGSRLLHRSTRKLTLTDAGSSFYARCADQVEALSNAAAELGEGSLSASGNVRVTALDPDSQRRLANLAFSRYVLSVVHRLISGAPWPGYLTDPGRGRFHMDGELGPGKHPMFQFLVPRRAGDNQVGFDTWGWAVGTSSLGD